MWTFNLVLCSRHRWAELQATNTCDYCRVEWPGTDIHSHCTVKPDVSLLLVFSVCGCISLLYLQQLIQQLQGLEWAGLSALHRRAQPLHQGEPRLGFAPAIQSRRLSAACSSEFWCGRFENHLAQQRTQPWDAAHGQEKLQHLQTTHTHHNDTVIIHH